jgi:hypothetical protein
MSLFSNWFIYTKSSIIKSISLQNGLFGILVRVLWPGLGSPRSALEKSNKAVLSN